MALVLADRVLETTTTAGSGTITLAGAEPGYQSFSAVGNGNQTYYTITADTAWEVGIGTYTASGTTLSRDTVLSSSASGAKVTFPAGVKKVFVTYPSEKSVNFNVSGDITAATGRIINLGAPSLNSDAATKEYVDNMTTAALHVHEAVVLATPASSGRNDTYNNGTAGVSATLTATANGTLTIDSTVAQAAQRVLIKDCDDQAENGIYVVTTVGDGSTAYVMTRASDADTYGEQGANSLDEGSYFFVTGGTSLKGAAFVCNTAGTITFGTTPITFGEFSQAQVYSAGNGISLTATTISLASPVVVSNGGTGLTSTPTNGQLLIGNGTGYTLSTLTAGSGVSITNSAGSITLSATGAGGTVTAVTATGPLASSGGTTPDISIANSTGTGSVVLENSPSIFSATITAALSASITTITGTSANITTVTGTTTTFSSGTISQLGATSATITTLSGTNVTYSSGTVSQLAATSATIATVSGTNVTYSNGNFTSATVTTVSGTTATYTSATVTNLAVTSVTISSLSLTNLAAASATITTGNLTFSSTAQRITGDMSNATLSNRLAFQTSTTNGNTTISALPNGTAVGAACRLHNSSDPANSSRVAMGVDSSITYLESAINGTGSYLPMTFYTGGSERVRIDTSGNMGIGLSSLTIPLQIGKGGGGNPATSGTTQTYGIARIGSSGAAALDVGTYAAGQVWMQGVNVTNLATNYDLVLQPNGSNVGIGRAPNYQLDVYRSGTTNTTIAAANDNIVNILQVSGNTAGVVGTITSHPLIFTAGNTERMRITSAGNVGIATSSASQRLAINSANTSTNCLIEWRQGDVIQGYTGFGTDNALRLQTIGTQPVGMVAGGAGYAFISLNGSERARFSAAGGFSVGTTADPGAGAIFATGNITAYYSDARLKDFKGKIGDALYKVSQLNGYYYTENEKAEEFGYNNKELQVGVSAQEVKAVLPEVVSAAPFDLDEKGESKSGENYMTVNYEKLVPLLIEAIKELKAEVEALKAAK